MKKESKIKILLPILAVIIVTVLIFNRLLFKLKDQIDEVALPIQSKVYNVANRAISIKDIIFSYEEIIAENENLKKENMELKIQKERNQKIHEENERLLKLLEMKENSQGTTTRKNGDRLSVISTIRMNLQRNSKIITVL